MWQSVLQILWTRKPRVIEIHKSALLVFHSIFYELLKKEIVQRRMIDRIHVSIIINESQSMVMFPMANKKGNARVGEEDGQEEIDMNSGFYSTDRFFHEWCLDYFDYVWQIAKPCNQKRLNEV